MATPTWLAATSGQPTEAGQINQLLGTHTTLYQFAGVVQSQQTTTGSGSTSSLGTYMAQSFTTGASQTVIGRIGIDVSITGGPTVPISVSIQANSAGAPSGTPLVTTLVPANFLNVTPAYVSIPVPVTGLTPSTTYWIVLNAAGTSGNVYNWLKSNQTSGASTSTNGTSWTAQTYGFLYQVFDNTANVLIAHTWEDGGARWTAFFYNATGQPATIEEFTVGQTSSGYMESIRTLAYTNGVLSSVS